MRVSRTDDNRGAGQGLNRPSSFINGRYRGWLRWGLEPTLTHRYMTCFQNGGFLGEISWKLLKMSRYSLESQTARAVII